MSALRKSAIKDNISRPPLTRNAVRCRLRRSNWSRVGIFADELYPEPIDERRLLTFAAWWELAGNSSSEISDLPMFAGPILSKIAASRPENVTLLDESLWLPNAVGVTRIAWERLLSGESDDLFTLQPYYSRPSAAEEKRVTRT